MNFWGDSAIACLRDWFQQLEMADIPIPEPYAIDPEWYWAIRRELFDRPYTPLWIMIDGHTIIQRKDE